jgi:hypothetical protein
VRYHNFTIWHGLVVYTNFTPVAAYWQHPDISTEYSEE